MSSRSARCAALATTALLLAGCAVRPPRAPGIGPEVPWSALRGWRHDDQRQAWPALLAECPRLAASPPWSAVCHAASVMSVAPSGTQARAFFQQWFIPHRVYNADGRRQGLMTGYYQPVVRGSLTRSRRYRYPLYRRPANLLRIDLGALYPALRGQRVRGRLVQSRVVPYYSRADIDRGDVLKRDELVWLDNPVTAFIVEVQGSGVVRLPDGRLIGVHYADQNGYPYRPMLECFQQEHIQPPSQLDLPGLKAWLNAHPLKARRILDCNPSFVFFALGKVRAEPTGALDVPLTPGRSIAVDPGYVPLGSPVWLEVPGTTPPIRRLMFAQDVDGAIRGPVRADIFWGRGRRAGRRAGQMKNPGVEFVLVPRAEPATPR